MHIGSNEASAYRTAAGFRRSTGQSPSAGGLIAALAIANVVLFAVYLGTILVVLPQLIDKVAPAAKVASLGWAGGLAALAAAIGTPVFGALSDRTTLSIGRRTPWLFGGSVVAFLAMVALARATTLGMVIGYWCVIQFALSAYLAALIAIIPDRIPPQLRGRASAAVGLGPAAGGLLGTMIAASLQHNAFAANALLGVGPVIAAAILAVVLREGRSTPTPVASAASGASGFSPMRYLRERDFMWLFVGRACIILAIFLVQNFYFFILQDFIAPPAGVTPADGVAQLALASSLAMIVATIVGGWLSDRIDRRKPFIFFASLVYVGAALVPIVYPGWNALLIFAALSGIGIGAYWSVDTALVSMVLPGEDRHGQDMAVMGIANAAPQAIAPLVGSVAIAASGYPALFILAGLLCLICALSVLLVRAVK